MLSRRRRIAHGRRPSRIDENVAPAPDHDDLSGEGRLVGAGLAECLSAEETPGSPPPGDVSLTLRRKAEGGMVPDEGIEPPTFGLQIVNLSNQISELMQ